MPSWIRPRCSRDDDGPGHGDGQGHRTDGERLDALTGVTITAYRNADENTRSRLRPPTAPATTRSRSRPTVSRSTGTSRRRAPAISILSVSAVPLMMDFGNASIVMVSQGTFDSLSNLAQGNQQPGNGLIGLVVTDGTNPIGGAMVTSLPASATPTKYNALVGNVALPSECDDDVYRRCRVRLQRGPRSGHGQRHASLDDARLARREGPGRRADDDGHRSLR